MRSEGAIVVKNIQLCQIAHRLMKVMVRNGAGLAAGRFPDLCQTPAQLFLSSDNGNSNLFRRNRRQLLADFLMTAKAQAGWSVSST
jgi:hypothetical protein